MMDEVALGRLASEHGLEQASIALDALDVPCWSLRVAPERRHYPASMIKLPIAMVLESLCEAGTRRLDETVPIEPANMTANDAPSPFVPGYRAQLGELARAMLADSDNVATNVLIDVLGRAALAAGCAGLGLRETAVRRKLSGALPLIADPEATGRNAHPANEAAALFGLLAHGLTRRPSWVYDALLAQRWNGKLAAGLGSGDRFAHKTGDTDEVSHDGGVLTLANGRRFVLVVYTGLAATATTDAKFAAFARDLRPRLSP